MSVRETRARPSGKEPIRPLATGMRKWGGPRAMTGGNQSGFFAPAVTTCHARRCQGRLEEFLVAVRASGGVHLLVSNAVEMETRDGPSLSTFQMIVVPWRTRRRCRVVAVPLRLDFQLEAGLAFRWHQRRETERPFNNSPSNDQHRFRQPSRFARNRLGQELDLAPMFCATGFYPSNSVVGLCLAAP